MDTDGRVLEKKLKSSFLIAQLLGAFPFRLQRKEGLFNDAKLNVYWFCIALINIVYSCYIYITMLRFIHYFYTVSLFWGFFNALLFFLRPIFCRNILSTMFELLFQVEDCFLFLQIPNRPEAPAGYFIAYCVINIACITLHCATFYNHPYMFGSSFIYFILNMFEMGSITVMISTLSVTRSYLQLCRRYLNQDRVEALMACHELLSSCCETINRCYGPQLLSVVSTHFLHATGHVYMGILTPSKFFHYIYYAFTYCTITFIIINSCTKASNEASQFKYFNYDFLKNYVIYYLWHLRLYSIVGKSLLML